MKSKTKWVWVALNVLLMGANFALWVATGDVANFLVALLGGLMAVVQVRGVR